MSNEVDRWLLQKQVHYTTDGNMSNRWLKGSVCIRGLQLSNSFNTWKLQCNTGIIHTIYQVMFARGFLLTCITTEGYLNCVILQFKGWCWSFPWNHHDQWIPYWAQNKRANLLHLVKDLWTSTGWFATLTTSKLSWQCWSLIKRRTGELLCRSVNCFTKATWF